MAFAPHAKNPIKHFLDDYTKDERLDIAKWRLVIRDAFDLGYFYKILHDWLIEEGFGPDDDPVFPELYYLQREDPTFGKEIQIRWRLTKKPDAPTKKNLLFTYEIDLYIKLLGVKSTEIVWKGQKLKADKGELEIECVGNLAIDKDKTWEKSAFKKIKEVYYKRIIANQFVVHKGEVHMFTYRLRDFITKYFKTATFGKIKDAEFYVTREGGE